MPYCPSERSYRRVEGVGRINVDGVLVLNHPPAWPGDPSNALMEENTSSMASPASTVLFPRSPDTLGANTLRSVPAAWHGISASLSAHPYGQAGTPHLVICRSTEGTRVPNALDLIYDLPIAPIIRPLYHV